MNNAVLALSGGMDSSTLLLRLLAEGYKVTALSFDYGQKHKIELERATQLVKYINDTYGLNLMLAPVALPGAAPVSTPVQEEHMTGLDAAQNKDLQRIVRDYSKGRMNEHMAIDRIKSYGVTEETAKKWLGIQMSIQMKAQDKYIAHIKSKVIQIDENDEIL